MKWKKYWRPGDQPGDGKKERESHKIVYLAMEWQKEGLRARAWSIISKGGSDHCARCREKEEKKKKGRGDKGARGKVVEIGTGVSKGEAWGGRCWGWGGGVENAPC